MHDRRVIVTGASGFVGRHLLDAWKERFRIFGIARRSQARAGAPVHPNITWYQVDIAERRLLEAAFREIAAHGGADLLIHLAAHYDFTGEEHPEYHRTNVVGLRNVLDVCRASGIRRVVFSSSAAACHYPVPGKALDESSPPDGRHIYSRTKRIGEAMLAEYRDEFHSVIVRFAALFSDWCEYPPLYMFMDTWLSNRWNRRLLGGRGASAIPFLHVHDVPMFFDALLDRVAGIGSGDVVLASPDGAVSHLQLFEAATREHFGQKLEPRFMPRLLCGPGIRAREALGRLIGDPPFERSWMAGHIDRRLTVDASKTRRLLDWEPRPRLEILRRMPFLVENLKRDPHEWNRRNRAAMKEVRLRPYLRVHELLARHEATIAAEFTARLREPAEGSRFASYRAMSEEQMAWNHKLVLRHLMNAVRTRERAVFTAYCGDLAERRFGEGFGGREVCDALQLLNQICFKVLLRDPEGRALKDDMVDHITMTLRVGCDRAQEVFETLDVRHRRSARSEAGPPGAPRGSPAP